ncbi:MAG: peptide-methionine (S)-S-oxide reductase MsrA [Gammaproteobacteria bacterium]|jgi:peptide-methionine (S)-S-oxide reductase
MKRLLLLLCLVLPGAAAAAEREAIFAGGCFWCTEADFEKLPGVIEAVSGYIGGSLPNPSYEQVSSGRSGHTEAVRVRFDTDRVSYAELVERFWRTIDPLTPNAQFCDRGSQYRSGIYYLDEQQKEAALASRQALIDSRRFDRPIVTEILPAGVFYPAETYHQDYARNNPLRYAYYRRGCGRDSRLEQLWGPERKP